MNLRTCLLIAIVVLAGVCLGPVRAHDPTEEYDRLPPPAAAPSPAACEKLAAQGNASLTEDDATKALRQRCAELKKPKPKPAAAAAPAKKSAAD